MLRSIRLQLTLWYIGSISLLVLIFGSMVLFSFRIVLRNDVDRMLSNGGTIFREWLTEYTMQDADEPASLRETADEGGEWLVDAIDEQTEEIFLISVAYIQVQAYPEEVDLPIAPRIIAKTRTLNEHELPLSSTAYHAIQHSPFYTGRPFLL